MVTAKLREAVYEVLKAAREPLDLDKIYARVKKRVPDECDDKIFPCPYCDERNRMYHPKWKHDVNWALQSLKGTGQVQSVKRGHWEVRTIGRVPPSPQVTSEPEQPEKLHDLLKKMIKEIGLTLNRIVYTEYKTPPFPYQYDIVWKERDALPPSHVFEVQDKGSLELALSKLQHAKDYWPARLFIVITGEQDRHKLEMLVRPILDGTFHKLDKQLKVLTSEEVKDMYRMVTAHPDSIKALMGIE